MVVKISLRRRHALTVADGAFKHKIDYVTIFMENLNTEGHPNRITGSKHNDDFAEWVDFAHWWSTTVSKIFSYYRHWDT